MRLLPCLFLLGALLAGCSDCQPMLDVRHCVSDSELCVPLPGGPEAEWNATAAAQWPDVDAALRGTTEGEHHHEEWTQERERAWWAYWGIDPDSEAKELFVHYDGGLFRIRVLSC